MPDRFPAEVASVLREAGWFAGRRADVEAATAIDYVRRQVGRHGARTEPFPAAIEALGEFGGLYVIQDGPGLDLRRRPFAIDPMQVAATTETLADLGRRLDTRLFPIGMEGDHQSVLAIDEAGHVHGLDHAGEWYLGETIDAALITLITGTQPPRLHSGGNWLPPDALAVTATPTRSRFLVTMVWDLASRGGLLVSGKTLSGKVKDGMVLEDGQGRAARVTGLEFLSPRDIATGEVTILVERTELSPARPGAILTEVW